MSFHSGDIALSKKIAAWQQRQPQQHSLIPSTPYKAFQKSTPKPKQATATLSSCSATIAEALVRLSINTTMTIF
jgi:hypothetical protein